MKTLLSVLALIFVPLANSAKIMFYLPLMSKSVKMCVMPLAEELGRRGHDVTLVLNFASSTPAPNITEIVVESDFERVTREMSMRLLSESAAGGLASLSPLTYVLTAGENTNDKALSNPGVRRLVNDASTKFDVVFAFPFLTNEVAYYLAHRFNASLVLFVTGQAALPWMDAAMGQPNNPSYMPMLVLPFSTPMAFWERTVNAVVSFVLHRFVR